MRVVTVPILIGSLFLIGAVPVAVAQGGSDSQVHAVATGNSSADRDSYAQRARNELQVWRKKLDQFDEKAKAKGRKADAVVDTELQEAWTETSAGAQKLQSVGAQGWNDARISYENASRHLADTWDRIRPEDK